MFWNKEKIEVYRNIPRSDATPIEAYWLVNGFNSEIDKDLRISNIFFALIIQLYAKKVIKIKKRDVCQIEFDFDNVDLFSSVYKKTIEDYSELENVKPAFNSEIGYFYNEILKMSNNAEALANELSLSLDEIAMLNLLKIVVFEHDGKITIETLYDTLMKRDYKAIREMNIEAIKFFFRRLLPISMYKKGFISEENKELKINEIVNHSENYLEESKLWKGFKKYLRTEVFEDIEYESISTKTMLSFLPYAIIFECGRELIEAIVLKEEGSYNKDYEIINILNCLTGEIKLLDKLENA